MKKFTYSVITLKALAFAAAILGALSSCVRDTVEPFPAGEDAAKELMLTMTVPGTAEQAARAITGTEENTIQTIDVLAFQINGTNETFVYSVRGTLASTNTAGAVDQSFTAKLQVQSYQQRFVVITNARTQVNALLSGRNWQGAAKATMLSNLKYNLDSGQDRWNAASSSNYTRIPMWGESVAETVTTATKQLSAKIYVMRMVARVDVKLDTSVSGLTSQFKLKSVALYNTNTGGQIVPDQAKVVQEQRNGQTYYRVNATTVPTELQPYSARKLGPINYTDFSAPGAADVSMIGAIYTFEATNTTTDSQATGLVIGGLYGSDTSPSYYRLDFRQTAGSAARLDLLRNHQYVVNITAVRDRGHATPDEAWTSNAVRITANILVWNQPGMDNLIMDGQNQLRTNTDNITLFSNQYTAVSSKGDNALNVFTDVPAGWTVSSITNADGTGTPTWVRLTPSQGATNQTTNAAVGVDQNTTGANRSAIITLAAGRMRLPVTVTQTTQPAIALNIYNNTSTKQEIQELIFAAAGGVVPASQTFYVDWLPATNSVSVAANQAGRAEFPNPGGNPASSDGAPYQDMAWTEQTGTKTFTVSPPALSSSDLAADPFFQRASRFDMTVNNGFTTMTKSITLRQLSYALRVEGPSSGANPFSGPYYAQIGGATYNYNVRANTNWKIKSVTSSSRTGDALIDSSIAADNVKVDAGNGSVPPNSTPGGGYKEQFTTTKTRNGNSGYVDVVYTPVTAGQFNDVTQRIYFSSKQFIIYSVCYMTNSEARDYAFWSGTSAAPGTPYTDHDMYTATQAAVNYGTVLNTNVTPYTTSGGNASTVFTAPIMVRGTWNSAASNTNITVADINAAVSNNADMLVISGDTKIPWTDNTNGGTEAKAIYDNFLAKDKPVFLCTDDINSVLAMFIVMRTNGKITGNVNGTNGANGNAPVYWYNNYNGTESVLNGPFGQLDSKYWGADGSGTSVLWFTEGAAGGVNVYSNANDQSGTTTASDPSNGATCFRFVNAPLIVVGDGGFLASRDQSGTTTFPTRVNVTTKIPGIGGGYGGGSNKFTVSNAVFTANVVAWAINRRTTQ